MATKYQIIIQQQKRNIKTYLMLCIVLAIGIFALGYFKYSEYTVIKSAVAENESYLKNLRDVLANEKVSYQTSKTNYDNLVDEMDERFKEVFPLSDNYTELTRAFDILESSLNRPKDPFLISNIDYQEIQTSSDGTYKYLPLRMTITASNDNFTKFMQYIERSGTLTEKIRLMDVQSINLNMTESKDTAVKTINFSIKINAYFQGNK